VTPKREMKKLEKEEIIKNEVIELPPDDDLRQVYMNSAGYKFDRFKQYTAFDIVGLNTREQA
jgi:hypothetical protein